MLHGSAWGNAGTQRTKYLAQIAAGDLSQRVDMGAPDTEVGRLSRSLNAMLAHIETAFRSKEQSEERMRRFIQDASHELRTPLVTIRGFSELYRHGGISEKEDVDAAMGRIEGEAKRMSQLVEDLLTLARLDEQRPLDHEPVDNGIHTATLGEIVPAAGADLVLCHGVLEYLDEPAVAASSA